MTLRVSLPAVEGAYEAAKWLKVPVLADAQEMEGLFSTLGDFELYPLGGVLCAGEISLPREEFLMGVRRWIEQLKTGTEPLGAELREVLACALTVDSQCLWLQEVRERYMVKIRRPVILIQAHYFAYSSEEGVFHSMVLGKENVFWGVQFSFPQIFMDHSLGDLCKVDESFANMAEFQQIRRWARDATRATPFLAGKKVNVPIRLGKRCFPWINSHPQLARRNLEVEVAAH